MNIHNNTDILAQVLNASWLRSEAISNNIANVDTPGYKRKDVAFESYLEQAMTTTGKVDSERLSKVLPRVYEDNSGLSYRMDGNNVDIDTEMSYLAQNQIKYNTLISQVNYNFKHIKMVLER